MKAEAKKAGLKSTIAAAAVSSASFISPCQLDPGAIRVSSHAFTRKPSAALRNKGCI
jgi:hypothetical protein